MVELAKTHITITDESASAAGGTTLRPLFVFATEQDKVINELTGEIASGTTKDLANQLLVVTSRTDAINSFGIPHFTTVNGTVQQGDELNEVGLYGMYDALGATSLAYALRADIDLKQLKSVEDEPRSKVKNNTRWLDTLETSFGIFINSDPDATKVANRWTQVTDIYVVDELNEQGLPKIDAIEGKIAIYFDTVEVGGKIQSISQKTFQAVKGFWYSIGSQSWKQEVMSEAEYGDAREYVEPTVYHSTYTSYPNDNVKGSIWVKTSATNNGVNYSIKQYKAETDTWKELSMPMASSFVEAESDMGASLGTTSLVAIYKEGTADVEFFKFGGEGFKVTGEEIGRFVLSEPKTISIDTPYDEVEIEFSPKDYTATVVVDTLKAGMFKLTQYGYSVEEENGRVVFKSSKGTAFYLGGDEDLLNSIKISEGEYHDWAVISNLVVKEVEPTAPAKEGTLWFNGDDYVVDIMVNDGDSWKGYNNEYPNAKIYVTSAEPEDITDDSLWIDPSDSEYPRIYRMIDETWELIDTTDQTTPLGVIFADARAYSTPTEEGIFGLEEDGRVVSNLLTSDFVEPDAPTPQAYPAGILLFNTRFSTNCVKEYKENPFEGLYDSETGKYTIGGFEGDVTTFATQARWVCASGNAANGAGLFGKKAQRAMVVRALGEAIVSNEDIRTMDIDFFFASCPGYPELDNELINLNTDKKEMFEIISDTPATLKPNPNDIIAWGTNKDNAVSHGVDGRVLKNEFVTRQYPPMGIATNVDGLEVAVPTSVSKMKNLLVLPRGQICAGTENGQVTNLASVGYITDEQEYASVVVNDGLGETLVGQSINPIMPRRNTGLLYWGEYTENPQQTSSLADEHGIITILRLKRDLEASVQPFFFKINNASLRADFHKVLQDVLDIYIGTGEIYDYTLVTDESVNTAARIGRKELWASIALELARGVEQIYLPIRVVATGSLSA
jgi:hypothetical protein